MPRRRRHPRQIRTGDEYQSGEPVNRVTVEPDPEPEFMGERWGESDHVPDLLRLKWNDERQTYERATDGNL